MTEILLECMKNVTGGYLLRQAVVIVVLAAAGLVCNHCLFHRFRHSLAFRLLLAFPLGLALYSVGGFALLLLGIPFNAFSMAAALLLTVVAVAVCALRKGGRLVPGRQEAAAYVIFLLAAAATAVFCCSGLLSVTIDNDSVYYYSTYPEIMAKTGSYLKYFDTFMTDVGQTSAVLNTLPFLYGFDNTFGIQHFMNLDFILFFAVVTAMLADRCLAKRGAGGSGDMDRLRPGALVAGVLAALFMTGSYPFIFISKWVMSNVYFMEYFCIIVALVLVLEAGGLSAGELRGCGFALFVLTAMLSMLRVEGVVVCAVLILCLSTLDIGKRTLTLVFILPVFILQGGFYAMLYLRMGVDPVYSFLDVKKALAITLGLIMLMVYILFVRDRVLKIRFIRERYRLLVILVLVLGNAAFLAVNTERYVSNLLTIYRNIRLGHGWGYFGIFMVLAAVLIAVDVVRGGFKDVALVDLVWVCFILTIIAACWARGGALRMGVGDSGNRIMMETVPLTVAVIMQKCYYYIVRR